MLGICKTVSSQVISIYEKVSILTITVQQVTNKISQYHNEYRNLLISYKSRQNVASYRKKIDDFIENSRKLFDVSFCKCANFSVCNCAKEKRVPQLETNFLEDQRTERKIFIGNVDKETTDLLKRREKHQNETSKSLREFSIKSSIFFL